MYMHAWLSWQDFCHSVCIANIGKILKLNIVTYLLASNKIQFRRRASECIPATQPHTAGHTKTWGKLLTSLLTARFNAQISIKKLTG